MQPFLNSISPSPISPAPTHPRQSWLRPAIQVVALNAAAGAQPGSRCDRYGSLSHGSGCPR